MTKKQIANILGITTRQHIDYVLTGKRHFSYKVAKKAVLLLGGTLDIWKEDGNEAIRKQLWDNFANGASLE